MTTIRGWKTRQVKGNPLISITIASYLCEDPRRWDSLQCLLYSLKAQTYTNWEALIIHDGPLGHDHETVKKWTMVEDIGEPQHIQLFEMPERRARFGHPWRSAGLAKTRGDLVCMSNDDNYYMPTFFEWMAAELSPPKVDFAYCDCIHSHKQWVPMKTELKRGKIDLGCWMADGNLVRGTPWTDFNFAGDWSYIQQLVAGARKVVKVPGTLFVHN